MTKVIYKKKNDLFKFIKISGHANFASEGNDIVCAGISSIVEGCCAFFANHYSKSVVVKKSNEIVFIKPKIYDDKIQICLKMMFYQLKNIECFYPRNLSFETTK